MKEKHLPYPPHVLTRMTRLRKEHQLTQKEVAQYLGIRQQTYSEYECGKSAMHVKELLKLAMLYDVSMDFLCGASNLQREFPRS